MDLVTIESAQEQNAMGRVMAAGNVREVWTSGRLCDKEVDGCEQARFQPYNIRGWFWAATLQSMGETNVFNGRRVSPAPPRPALSSATQGYPWLIGYFIISLCCHNSAPMF